MDDSVDDMNEIEWTEPEEAFADMEMMVGGLNELKREFDALTIRYMDGLAEIRARGWGDEWNAYLMGEDGDGSGLGDV